MPVGARTQDFCLPQFFLAGIRTLLGCSAHAVVACVPRSISHVFPSLYRAGMGDIPGTTFGQQMYAAERLERQTRREQRSLDAQVLSQFLLLLLVGGCEI